MTPITIRGLRKTFGSTVAVDSIDLDIAAGDLFFLLGPSGCGKTTLLRMLAGFTDPDGGTIRFGDDDVTHLAPNHRKTGMVFQGYALWPHMTVRQNVRFGLEVRSVGKDELARRVDEALDKVQLTVQADRKINQLSGGQQQRVALARALVIKPRVLLLDEPLSNLDAKLRLEMRRFIRDICKSSGITGVYVTHDQHEALSMADDIAVLRGGQVVQKGPPRGLYERPMSRFVADFLGETNFVPAEVVGVEPAGEGQAVVLSTSFGTLRSTVFTGDVPVGGNVTCSIRPESVRMVDTASAHGSGSLVNRFAATRHDVVYLGSTAQDLLTVDEQTQLRALRLNPAATPSAHDQVELEVSASDVVILHD